MVSRATGIAYALHVEFCIFLHLLESLAPLRIVAVTVALSDRDIKGVQVVAVLERIVHFGL